MPGKKKQRKNSTSLQTAILELIEGRRYSPLPFKKLVKKLQLPKELDGEAQTHIDQLVKDGRIAIKDGLIESTKPAPKEKRVIGKASVHPKGFAFVAIDGEEKDVFIPKNFTQGAVDKDLVEVIVEAKVSAKGPEGKIVNIVQRAREELICTIEEPSPKGGYYAFSTVLGIDKDIIIKSETFLNRGDRVRAKITAWGDEKKATEAILKEELGSIDQTELDVSCAAEEFGLDTEFSKEVIKEAKNFGTEPPEKLEEGRQDLTKLTSFTIDPTTAKDFDDALSIEQNKSGNYQLAVHIADVSHYVKVGSKLDGEAFKRGNSTYMPGSCIPMLPEELSNELCSLKANVRRFTVSVLMDLRPDGTVEKYKIVKGVIKSCKRFTYEEAMEVLQGKAKSPLLPQLKLLVELCHKFKALRSARGSVDLAMPDIKLDIDEKGKPTGFHREEYDITHQLVEECMLKANEIVATHLKDQGKGSIFRIHEAPAAEQFKDFGALATLLGYSLPRDPSPEDLQQIFQEAQDSPMLHQLSTAYIRSMKLAVYSPENVGHYGLSLDYYTHFTSPIRRYSDLVIHRLLFEKGYEPDLKAVSEHCSATERVSFRAEMQVLQLKKLRLLKSMFDKDPKATYDAVITKVRPFGIEFELANLLTDGFIHISDLSNDYFNFNPEGESLEGSKTGERYTMGKKVKLKIGYIDLVIMEIHWQVCN